MPTFAPRVPRTSRKPTASDATSPSVSRLPRSGRDLWNAGLVIAPAAVIAVLAWSNRWLGDDALIYTRAVRQILAGNGPVINVTERAETSTGTLWQWMVAAGGYVSAADPAMVAVVLGLLCTVLGVLAAVDGTRRLHGSRQLLLPAGILVLCPVKAMWDYGTSGLETGLIFGWLGCSWWLLVRALRRPSRPRTVVGTGVVLGLGPLVRPDFGIVTLVFLAVLWWLVRPGRRTTAATLAAAFAMPAGYEIFRAGYYGILVPLPGITKEASVSVWAGGVHYLRNFAGPYELWVPLPLLAVLAVAGARHARKSGRPLLTRGAVLALTPVVAGLLCCLYVVRVGGDFMHGRMLLPAFFLGLLPFLLVPWNRTSAVITGCLGVWSLSCLFVFRPPVSSSTYYQVLDEQRVYTGATAPRLPVTQSAHRANGGNFLAAVDRVTAGGGGLLVLERTRTKVDLLPLAERFGDRTAGARGALGQNGLAVPLDGLVVDTLSLAHPFAAHQDTHRPGRAGHNKPLDRAWVLADYTDLTAGQLPEWADPRQVAAAREALRCGSLAELRAATRDPMTPDRFWKNLTGAWERTQFRYPGDPVQARKALCDG